MNAHGLCVMIERGKDNKQTNEMEAQMLLRSQSEITDKEVIMKSSARKKGEFKLTFCS
jgi:hypothetical protein